MNLTRKECEKSLNHLIKGAYSRWYRFHGATAKPKYINQVPIYKGDYKAIQKYQQLIEEFFELKEKHSKTLDDVHDYRYEIAQMKTSIRNLCKHFGVNNLEELKSIYLNPPLTFEELHEGMWVWDNKIKRFIKIAEVEHSQGYFIIDEDVYLEEINDWYDEIWFEENRFYRRQVKE